MKVSLHLHSNYTDGGFSVEQILKMAGDEGIDLVCITDHNEIAGSIESGMLAPKYGVKVIYGMELFFWYRSKITELLVYFKTPDYLTHFYQDFLGNQFIPTVHTPQELTKLVEGHEGVAMMPHPTAMKGCIRNRFRYPTCYAEKYNTMTGWMEPGKEYVGFGGADLHLIKDAMKCYTEVQTDDFERDFFTNNLKQTKIITGPKLGRPRRWVQMILVLFLDIKYLTRQLIRSKLRK